MTGLREDEDDLFRHLEGLVEDDVLDDLETRLAMKRREAHEKLSELKSAVGYLRQRGMGDLPVSPAILILHQEYYVALDQYYLLQQEAHDLLDATPSVNS